MEGLRVGARAGHPLPVAIVLRELSVEQLGHEVRLAEPPVEQQVLGEKRPDDHARAVVHEARRAELAHARIHQRNSRAPLLPAAERAIVVPPAHAKRPHRLARDPGVRRQQLGEEITPRELPRPDAHALAQRRVARQRGACPPHGLGTGEGSPAQMRREPRRRVETGQIAGLGIAADAVAQERVESGAGSVLTRGRQLDGRGRLGDRPSDAGERARRRPVARHLRHRRHVERLPGTGVRAVDLIRAAAGGHRSRGVDERRLGGTHGHTVALERPGHARLARTGCGLVVAGVAHDPGAQRRCETRQLHGGVTLDHQQSRAEGVESRVERPQAGVHVRDAPRGARVPREQRGIQDEHARHRRRAGAPGERRVVVQAEIAGEPVQRRGDHDPRADPTRRDCSRHLRTRHGCPDPVSPLRCLVSNRSRRLPPSCWAAALQDSPLPGCWRVTSRACWCSSATCAPTWTPPRRRSARGGAAACRSFATRTPSSHASGWCSWRICRTCSIASAPTACARSRSPTWRRPGWDSSRSRRTRTSCSSRAAGPRSNGRSAPRFRNDPRSSCGKASA